MLLGGAYALTGILVHVEGYAHEHATCKHVLFNAAEEVGLLKCQLSFQHQLVWLLAVQATNLPNVMTPRLNLKKCWSMPLDLSLLPTRLAHVKLIEFKLDYSDYKHHYW